MEDLLATLLNADAGKFIAALGLLMWLDIRGSVKSMAKDLGTLTVQMATVVERVDSHEKRIDKLES